MTAESPLARFGSGQSVRRVEDDGLLKGTGQFADDVAVSGEACVMFLRSPHAHARVTAIDTAAAAAIPGVLGVLTGGDLLRAGVKPLPRSLDFRRGDGSPSVAPPQYALAVDVVRHVGEVVAVVVAENRAVARDALDAIDVRYETLSMVADLVSAVRADAPLVWPAATGNVAAQMQHGDPAVAAAAFARAAHTVAIDLVNQRVAPCPIEPRTTSASFEVQTGRITLRVSSQTPTGLRDTLCGMMGLAPDAMRVLVGDVGGGFGMKTTAYAEDLAVAYCARAFKRPVKWCAERIEEFLSASHGRDVRSKAELALDATGRILALRVRSHANLGAYATPAGVAIQLLIGPWVSTSVYDIQTIDINIAGVLTNTTPTGPYRGAGRPEAIYLIERLLDAAARQTGIDRVTLRRRNMIRPEQMPYKNPMGKTYDTGKFESILDQAQNLADWEGYPARAIATKQKGRLRGRGIATFLEWTGADAFTERVTVTVTATGIEIFSATQAMGQGLATTYAQLAVDVFGVPIEKITVLQGDTDRGTGFGSAGSRSLFVGGSAIHVAAQRTVAKAQELAANELESAAGDIEYRDGVFSIGGTDRQVGLFDLAEIQPQHHILLESQSSVEDCTWPNGCHICEVEIDPATGDVAIDGYWSVNDVGRVVNPLIVIGQLEGGAVQGIGQALCEEFVHDNESGQALTASLQDYALPRAQMIKHFEMTMDPSIPCKNNLLGVKGVGELGTIGGTPAVANAVLDALAQSGLGARADALQIPLTPEKIWQALHG